MDTMENIHACCPDGRGSRRRRGPSSFWMNEPSVIFRELDLQPGDVFLDLGCGTGDYSICAAEEVGETGIVYAADIQKHLINDLLGNARAARLDNIRGIVSNINEPLPFEDRSVDVCFISTVLHSMDLQNYGAMLFQEIARVVKPEGRMIIIECKKEEMQFGPPLSMRLSAEDIEVYTSPCGFTRTSFTDLGYNYLVCYSPKGVGQ